MAIDPGVQGGLGAYQRGDWNGARHLWEETATEATGDEHELLRALADLAAALGAKEERHPREAGQLLEAARRRLRPLAQRATRRGRSAAVLGVDTVDLHEALAGLDGPHLDPSRAPAVQALPLLPAGALFRFLLFLVLIAAAFAALKLTPLGELLDRERLLAIFSSLRAAWWTPLALLGLYLALTPLGLPVSPLIFAGGMVFGFLWGGLLNVAGTLAGCALSYFLARGLGRDLVTHLFGHRLEKFEKTLARQGFWPLVRIRFLPVPFPVVNYGAALAGVPAPLFLLSSTLGLVPSVMIFTYFAAALSRVTEGARAEVLLQLALALVSVLLLSFLPTAIRARARRRRYRELLGRRREQGR